MFKSAALAMGVAAADYAEINVFHPTNFLKVDVAKQLINQTVNDALHKKEAVNSAITWKSCTDKVGHFKFDQSSTSVSPDPPVKGSKVNLNLGGKFSAPEFMEKAHVHVTWNGTNLYDQDITIEKQYSSAFHYTVGWDIPSYAPSGAYHVEITGYEKDGTTSDMCLTADFKL